MFASHELVQPHSRFDNVTRTLVPPTSTYWWPGVPLRYVVQISRLSHVPIDHRHDLSQPSPTRGTSTKPELPTLVVLKSEALFLAARGRRFGHFNVMEGTLTPFAHLPSFLSILVLYS